MTKTLEKKTIDIIKQKVVSEGGSAQISSCPRVLLAAAAFGRVKKEALLNASFAAEFFYQALFSHYWLGQGKGQYVILGDYFGSTAITYAVKLKDQTILNTFCQAIQEATKNEDNEHKAAGRLAKIYGASAFVGAYLAGLRGEFLEDHRQVGEETGLRLLNYLK